MNKQKLVLFCLLAIIALTFTSCETLLRAFAEQTGRNAADSLWGKRSSTVKSE